MMSPRLGRSLIGTVALAFAMSTDRTVQADESPQQVHPNVERVPSNAFWTGARVGVFMPYGDLYSDPSLVSTPFQDVATAGPAMEFDAGARFALHFVGYGFVEQAFLGRGKSSAWTAPHGGQLAPSTQAAGIGLRWESNPAGWGIVADVAIAYRWFTVRWEDATTVSMSGPADVRFGLGATWRATRTLTLAPMMTASSGAFANRTLDGQKLGESTGSYASLALSLSGHFDVD
jgi:hypothetical protein